MLNRYNAVTGESTYEDPTSGVSPWTEAWDDDAEVPYWYNEETQESTYENPHIGALL
jgi:GH18 family chitinase